MANHRRSSQEGDPLEEIRLEVEDAVETQEAPELGEESVDSESEELVSAAGPEEAPALGGVVRELPVCLIVAREGAEMSKPTGEVGQIEEGTLLAAYGWLEGGGGVVAANLGEHGKWFIRADQWVVYRKEA